jgi:hypothetical protein
VVQDFLTTDFDSSKSYFFLVFTHPGLIHCEKLKIQQLGPKMAIFEPQQEGSNLDQIQKYFVWCLLGPIPRFLDPGVLA